MTEPGRLWLLRALALAIALGLWFSVSVEDRDAIREKTVEASVTFDKPEDLMILDAIEPVRVRVRGPDRDVDRLAPYMVQVEVELAAQGSSVLEIPLSPSNVDLPSGYNLEVRSVEPNVLRLEVDREITRTLPLQPSFTGEPAAGARVLHDLVEIQPRQATISGPAEVLKELVSLDLTPINLDGHALPFEETASVIPPGPNVQVVENARVTVRVPMQVETAPATGG